MDTYVSADCIPRMLDGYAGVLTELDDDGNIRWEWHILSSGYDGADWLSLARPDCPPTIWDDCDTWREWAVLDTRRPEVRDHLARVVAWVLGVPVGATAPRFRLEYDSVDVDAGGGPVWTLNLTGFACNQEDADSFRFTGLVDKVYVVPSLASIPLDSPDREALALAAIVRWIGDEIKAGRVKA